MKNQYIAYFDFTTVAGSRFTGRSGQCGFESDNDMLQVLKDIEELKPLCAEFILSRKPKWRIFNISITKIEPIKIYPKGMNPDNQK